ncbi:MAG: hypothetical protein SO471_08240 [Anaerobutyricum hallii]|uniref:hypothetical protein n=1 Tax=Anaerobutyricum hallii TaxID=39488 RepID=UPI002A83E9F9|nr:hypothetical protein [Anaerobutyricum hallii]MDY4577940.1 hypothetical protein [Anaerobutyricum hallii]
MANSKNVKFFFTDDKSKYDELVQKDSLALYFIEDTKTGYKALYKGNNLIAVGSDATSTVAGLMSVDDKKKLDTIDISELVTKSELESKGYLTELQIQDEYAKKTDLDNKQDKLTAGNNITIVDGVISATGGSGSSAVNSVNGKTGYVVLTASDIITNSTDANKISVLADGTLEVSSLTFDKLIQNESDKLVIFGGNA